MTYYATSYDTSFGKIHSTKNIESAIQSAFITGELESRNFGIAGNGAANAAFVIGGSSEENTIPPFIHPLVVKNFKGKNYCVTDIRQFRTSDALFLSQEDFEKGVRNKTEYQFVKARALMNVKWLDEKDREYIRGRFGFAGSVYAAWLSQAIGQAYALDPQSQLTITAIGIYFYHTLFLKEAKLSQENLEKAVIHTINATKIRAEEIYTLFENLGEMPSIEQYCIEVKKNIQNIRLKDFNVPMLLTIVRNSWYGTNAPAILSVAIEHPPTWICIVYATLTDRSFKNSKLYKTIDVISRRGNADEFERSFSAELFSMAVEEADNSLVVPEFKG